MDLNDLNIDFHMDTSPRFNPPNQIMRDFRINALHSSTEGELELSEHGRALLQEYIDGARSYLTIEPEHPRCLCVMPGIEPRRKRAYCNTRVKMVQAKRKALDLGQDGKCCLLRTRKASLALRLAEQDWYNGRRSEQPLASEFERIPPRVQRKRVRDAKRFARAMGLMKPIELSPYEKWWFSAQVEERAKVVQTIEDMAGAMNMSVSTAHGALIDVFNAYGKEETMTINPTTKPINWVATLPRYVREWITDDLKYRLSDIYGVTVSMEDSYSGNWYTAGIRAIPRLATTYYEVTFADQYTAKRDFFPYRQQVNDSYQVYIEKYDDTPTPNLWIDRFIVHVGEEYTSELAKNAPNYAVASNAYAVAIHLLQRGQSNPLAMCFARKLVDDASIEDDVLFTVVKMGVLATKYTASQICTAAYQAYNEVEREQANG